MQAWDSLLLQCSGNQPQGERLVAAALKRQPQRDFVWAIEKAEYDIRRDKE